MSSERTFCLFKDVSLEPVYKPEYDLDFTRLYPKDISSCGNSKDIGESSFPCSLAAYIEELRKSNGYVLDLRYFGGVHCSLQIHLNKELPLDRLCSILAKPFLRIHCKQKLPPTNIDGFAYEKRLQISDIVEIYQTTSYIRLFSVDPRIKCFTIDVTLGWVEPPCTQPSIRVNFVRFIQSLFEKDSSKDLTIVAGNGAEIKCHRMIFEAHSDVLSAMISPNGMQESRNGRIEMVENSEEGLSHLIRYLYGMELKIEELSCDVAIELFKTAHKYKLAEILKWLGEIFLLRGNDWFTPDDLLELYFHVKNLAEFKAIEEYALRIMLSISKEIRACERLKELKGTDPEAAFQLLSVFLDMATDK